MIRWHSIQLNAVNISFIVSVCINLFLLGYLTSHSASSRQPIVVHLTDETIVKNHQPSFQKRAIVTDVTVAAVTEDVALQNKVAWFDGWEDIPSALPADPSITLTSLPLSEMKKLQPAYNSE
jgi:hypothetical protein